MFNQDLEELNKKQSVMNNTTTEMKNTLEGWISVLEDRKVEITKAEQNKEKRMKRNKNSETSEIILNALTFES